jgi:IS5 family transposase
MYRKKMHGQLYLSKFFLPFGGKLRADNQWVQLAELMPWEEIEKHYVKNFKGGSGQKAISARIAFGAVYIQLKCGYTDVQTVEEIRENPYLQYFLGYTGFSDEPPFDSSMMVHFRKRITVDFIQEITDKISKVKDKDDDHHSDDDKSGGGNEHQVGQVKGNEQPNKGKLLLDATCTPADIHYPTDIRLLNDSREKLEEIIDELFEQVREPDEKRPRDYRKNAGKDYLAISKQRNKPEKTLQKAMGKQLRYLERDLKIIDHLSIDRYADRTRLKKELCRKYDTIRAVFQQQSEMYHKNVCRVEDRIVSLSQPFVRPIKRGKAGANTEFGAKVAISIANGYATIDKISWDNFNEALYLKQAVESYKAKNGCYPEAVLADQIYRNHDNRVYCKKFGIRISGPRLGRPKKNEVRGSNRQAYLDSCERNAVEGEFGTGKRRYGLDRIMAHLKDTSECVIAMHFFIMNMEHKLRLLFVRFLRVLFDAVFDNFCPFHACVLFIQ